MPLIRIAGEVLQQLPLALQGAKRGARTASKIGASPASKAGRANIETMRNLAAPRAVDVPVVTPQPAVTPEIPGLYSVPDVAAPVVESAAPVVRAAPVVEVAPPISNAMGGVQQLDLNRALQSVAGRGPGGRIQSYAGPRGAAGARNVETVGLAASPRAVDMLPDVAPSPASTRSFLAEADPWTGEIDILPAYDKRNFIADIPTVEGSYQAPMPVFDGLQQMALEDGPGTVSSIRDLARRASDYYGVPVTADDVIFNRMPATYAREGSEALREVIGDVAAGPKAFEGNVFRAPRIRSAVGGTQMVDLAEDTFQALPAARGRNRALALAGALGAAGGLGSLAYLASRGDQAYEEPTFVMEAPEAPALPAPVVNPRTGELLHMPSSTPGQAGSGSVVTRINDSDSNYRQAKANAIAALPKQASAPKAMGDYGMAADYYAARKAYVSQPEVADAVVAEVEKTMPGFSQWARANPTLAYELIKKTAGGGL